MLAAGRPPGLLRPAIAVFCGLLACGTVHAQQSQPISVAVLATETADGSADLARQLTDALRATAGLTGHFELYDTALTRKATASGDPRSVPRLATRYMCVSRVTRSNPGWAQVTILFVDSPVKDPVVRLGSPVLLRSDSAFLPLARLAWERLAKLEAKRLDSLRGRSGPGDR